MTAPHTAAATMTVAESVRASVATDRAVHSIRLMNRRRWSLHRTATHSRVSRAMNARGLRLPTTPWIGPPWRILPSTQI